jgi:hypothetical protein
MQAKMWSNYDMTDEEAEELESKQNLLKIKLTRVLASTTHLLGPLQWQPPTRARPRMAPQNLATLVPTTFLNPSAPMHLLPAPSFSVPLPRKLLFPTLLPVFPPPCPRPGTRG